MSKWSTVQLNIFEKAKVCLPAPTSKILSLLLGILFFMIFKFFKSFVMED